MKNAPLPQNAESSALNSDKFTGTNNPRHVRAILALLKQPLPRESLDKRAGCSNGPELIAELRRRGLALPCDRIDFIDRDGRHCRPGVYSLSRRDRTKVTQWFATKPQNISIKMGDV